MVGDYSFVVLGNQRAILNLPYHIGTCHNRQTNIFKHDERPVAAHHKGNERGAHGLFVSMEAKARLMIGRCFLN
jgi:hypothetical protein